MSISLVDPGVQTLFARCSCLVLISLVSCARADSPEAFVADPSMLNDFTSSLPATGESQGFKYEIVQGQAILEGDIVLGIVDSEGNLPKSLTARGVGNTSRFSRWPDGIVVYEPLEESNSSVLSSTQQTRKEKVDIAIQHWEDNTNISFVARTEENADLYPNYIKFFDMSGCASHVGMIGGEQPIYIIDACSVGSVIHELGHAVGLFHEHTRPDRDSFVTIDWNEVMEGRELNFELLTAGVTEYSDYDYGSIMHYGETFFSKSGRPTIIVSDDIEIGQREALSEMDIQSANNMYETDLAVTAQIANIAEGEYEIDLSTYNYGELGANEIELLLRLDKVLEWKDISQDSGWSCVSDEVYLRCNRDTFIEQTQSLFNVQVSSLTEISDSDLQVRLSSRTQDSDPTNNSINDDGTDWDEVESGTDLTENRLQTRSVDSDDSPDIQAANGTTEPADTSDSSSESSSESSTSSASNTSSSNSSSNSNSSSSSSSTDSNSGSETTLASASATESSSGGSLSGLLLALLGVSFGLRRITDRTRRENV